MEDIIQMSSIFEGQLCWRTKMAATIYRSHHFLIVFKQEAGLFCLAANMV